MYVINQHAVELFGQKMIAQLVEYEVDTTYRTYPYNESEGKKTKMVRKIRIKDKFNYNNYIKLIEGK